MDPRFIREALFAYGPAFMAPALWAYATFPEKLEWTSALNARIFGAVAGLYDGMTSLEEYGEPLEQALMDLRSSPERILDLGTGTGFAGRILARRFPSARVVGADVSGEMLAIARQAALDEAAEMRFTGADGARLPFADGAFDLVVQHNVFPYPDELMRVCAPGGRVLIVYSFGGPWVALAWPALAERLSSAGAMHTRERRVAFGFYGSAKKGVRQSGGGAPYEKEPAV